MGDNPTPDPHQEPADSTVDDWFGQSVARDAEHADRFAEDAPPPEGAPVTSLADARRERQERRLGGR